MNGRLAEAGVLVQHRSPCEKARCAGSTADCCSVACCGLLWPVVARHWRGACHSVLCDRPGKDGTITLLVASWGWRLLACALSHIAHRVEHKSGRNQKQSAAVRPPRAPASAQEIGDCGARYVPEILKRLDGNRARHARTHTTGPRRPSPALARLRTLLQSPRISFVLSSLLPFTNDLEKGS